jgi:hypothetical protein
MPFIDPPNPIKPYGTTLKVVPYVIPHLHFVGTGVSTVLLVPLQTTDSPEACPYNQFIKIIRRVGRLRPTVKFRKIKWVVKNPYFHLISFALLNSFSTRRSLLKYFY